MSSVPFLNGACMQTSHDKITDSGRNHAESWKSFLRSHRATDLLMVESGGRLYYGKDRISLHWLDRVSLLLVRRAVLKRTSLAIVYPVPICNLPVLAAAQLFVQDITQNNKSDLRILLLSPRIEVRAQYINLNVDGVPLASVYPLAVSRESGKPNIVRLPGELWSPSSSPRDPHLYHMSQRRLLDTSWTGNVDVVIVDHTGGKFDEDTGHIHDLARKHGVKTVIHFGSDPFASYLDKLREKGVPIWVWDHLGLAADFGEQITAGTEDIRHPFGVSPSQFRNIAAGIRHNLLLCRYPDMEQAARFVWDDLATIQRTFSGTTGTGIRSAIRFAYGTFYAMLHMVVPLPVYEEEARRLWGVRTIRRRISDLEAFTPMLRDEARDLAETYWPSLISDLKDMHDSLKKANPKYTTLVQQVREHISQGKELAIVCPNRATQRMLQLCLRAREGLPVNEVTGEERRETTRLITYKNLSRLTSADTLLFPGQFSYGRRQYALTAAAPEIRYLAYSEEADRIERQVVAIHRAVSEMASARNRERVWALLAPFYSHMRVPAVTSPGETLVMEFMRSEGDRISRRKITASGSDGLSLWTPFSTPEYDLFHGDNTLDSERENTLRPSEFAPPDRQSILVPALRIDFMDGFCYAEPESTMTVFLSSTETTDERKVDGLRPGDIVVFVNGNQRQRLYEAILERIEAHPTMGKTYILVKYWQEAVNRWFFQAEWTYDDFLWKLQMRGSKIQTPQAVRNWVVGQVLGPRDGADIRRVGEIFDDGVLMEEWKSIDMALRRVRGLHLSLARKLNQIIVDVGLRGISRSDSEECIDPELNLYLDDFRDSVTLHRIVSVGEEISQVPYVFTGRFFEKGRGME